MKNSTAIKRIAVCAILPALSLIGAGWFVTTRVEGQEVKPQTLRGAAALDRLKQDGQYESLQAAMNQARYSVSLADATPLGRSAWHAPNAAAGYDAYVTEEGVSIAVNNKSYVSLSLRGVGYGEALQSVAQGGVRGDKQTITINRNHGLSEWFINTPEGLEHGFTLNEPPGARQQGEPLRLALQVSEGWRAVASDDGKLVTLRSPNDQAVEYGKLVVRDKLGRNIAARLAVADEQIVIEVEDHAAQYPLTIDPLFTLQQRLTAADAGPGDHFGYAVAIDGDTALVGALYEEGAETDQGAAYVFVRNGAAWTQQAKLFANDGASNDFFGWAVALEGDTALVGAPGDDTGRGSVYVFTRNGASWTQRQKLRASDGFAGAQFGAALALDGDTALVGAHEQTITPSFAVSGAAYVFVRNGATWTLQQRLLSDDIDDGDRFGVTVALDGDTALIGAPNNAITVGGQGAAYIFTRNGAMWTQQQRLVLNQSRVDDHLGNAVALSGDKALIGAYLAGSDDEGAVYTFRRSATGWKQTDATRPPNPTPGAHFGVSVAMSGDLLLIGASLGLPALGVDQRSAYVFVDVGEPYFVRSLGPELGAANDRFGYAVALDGDTALIGAYLSKVSATGQGAAYAFTLRDSRSVEKQQLIASDGAKDDFFGNAVALDGDTLAVGAFADNVGANEDQGSVYVFTRNGAVWTFQQKLIANDGAAFDQFGYAVALDGDTLAVGANLDRIGANSAQGSAYVFTRNETIWTQQAKLAANDGAANDSFGSSIALDGDTVVVGAPHDAVTIYSSQGSAYVFTRNGTLWGARQKLTATDGAAFDEFGKAVALDGDTLVIGAHNATVGTNAVQGAAYVFRRNGPVWAFIQKLTANKGTPGDNFGAAVAINRDTMVVGAPSQTVGANKRQGSAYVFARAGAAWAEREKLVAGDGGENDFFGAAVAVSSDLLVVGAIQDAIGSNSRQGSVHVFTHIGGWRPQQKLTASDGAANDFFGGAVAVSGDTVVAGADSDSIGANNEQGSVYVFVSPSCPAITIAPDSLPDGRLNQAYSQQLTASGGAAGDYLFMVSRGSLPPGLMLDSPGLLHGAPTATGTYRFTITATFFLSGCSGSRDYTITVTPPCPPITVLPETLPDGATGAAYSQRFTATGGAAPYSFTVAAGALPAGLSLSNAGVLGGTPTQAGNFNFTLRITDANGCAETRALTLTIKAAALAIVSAASYKPGAAPESIAAVFGSQMATQTQVASGLPLPVELAGVRVRVRDSQGVERLAPLFFVSPGQINLQIPPGTAAGTATVTVSAGAVGQVEIKSTVPGLFAANADGQGVPAAVALRVKANGAQSYEAVAQFNGTRFTPLPIDLGPAGEQVFLVLYGTGLRFKQTATASIGGMNADVLYVGAAAGFVGLDQINLIVPRALIGRGEVELALRADGATANAMRVNLK